jgi:hypothetical protein
MATKKDGTEPHCIPATIRITPEETFRERHPESEQIGMFRVSERYKIRSSILSSCMKQETGQYYPAPKCKGLVMFNDPNILLPVDGMYLHSQNSRRCANYFLTPIRLDERITICDNCLMRMNLVYREHRAGRSLKWKTYSDM